MKYKDMIIQRCIIFLHQQCLLYPSSSPPPLPGRLSNICDDQHKSHDLQILKHATAWEELFVFVDYFKVMA